MNYLKTLAREYTMRYGTKQEKKGLFEVVKGKL